MNNLFVAHNLFPISPPHGVSLSNQYHFSQLYFRDHDLSIITTKNEMIYYATADDYFSISGEAYCKLECISPAFSRLFCFLPFLFPRRFFSILKHLSVIKPKHIYISCFTTGISEAYALAAILLRIPYSFISHGVSIFPRYTSLSEYLRSIVWTFYIPLLSLLIFCSKSIYQLPFSFSRISLLASFRRLDLFISRITNLPTRYFLPLTIKLSSTFSVSHPPLKNSIPQHDICWIGSSSHIKNFDLFLETVSNFPSLSFASLDNLPSIAPLSHPNLTLYDPNIYTGFDIIQNSRALLITSHSEVFPIIFLEAIASRKIVISNFNNSLDSIDYSQTYYYSNPLSLSQTIHNLFYLSSPSLIPESPEFIIHNYSLLSDPFF